MRNTTRMRRVVALAGAAALATTVLAGCGDDGDKDSDDSSESDKDSDDSDDSGDPFADSDADEVLEVGFDALADAESFHLSGDLEGTEIDLSLDSDGNCEGEVSDQGFTAELLGVDGTYWLRGDDAFWTQAAGDPAAATVFAGKWVLDEEGEFAEVCSIDGLLGSFGASPEVSDLEKGDTVDTDAGEALELNGREDGDDVLIQVLLDEPHYIAGFSFQDDELSLSEFDEPLDVSEPPASEVIDPAEFAG